MPIDCLMREKCVDDEREDEMFDFVEASNTIVAALTRRSAGNGGERAHTLRV